MPMIKLIESASVKTDKNRDGEKPMANIPFMHPPEPESTYEVGDAVEVYCDHDKGGQRIRGWLKGIVVQVDAKMVAVQFRTDVFLTDGWMVPDHILWYPQHSAHIRFPEKKSSRALQNPD
jgi:hypothetical protein